MSGPPDPTHFADGSPVPRNTGPQYPAGTGGGGYGGSTYGFTQEQQAAIENAVHSNPDLQGVWDGIVNAGGDVWGVVKNILPKNADGSVDWGKLGSDVAGWFKNNTGTILQGLNAINQYQRQQQSDKYAKQALDLATKSYAAKQPLRDAGQAGMLNPHAGTPDLSSLKAQGQQGASNLAPLPMAAPQTAYQNAAKVAGNNPFTQGLPLAGAPVGPGGPQGPGAPPPFTPKPPTPVPSPLGPPGQLSPTPSGPFTPSAPTPTGDNPGLPMAGVLNGSIPAPGNSIAAAIGYAPKPVPQALQLAPQSGPISAGPQNRTLPPFPSGLPQYGLSPLPLAGG